MWGRGTVSRIIRQISHMSMSTLLDNLADETSFEMSSHDPGSVDVLGSCCTLLQLTLQLIMHESYCVGVL